MTLARPTLTHVHPKIVWYNSIYTTFKTRKSQTTLFRDIHRGNKTKDSKEINITKVSIMVTSKREEESTGLGRMQEGEVTSRALVHNYLACVVVTEEFAL